jgi:hypothetical protein
LRLPFGGRREPFLWFNTASPYANPVTNSLHFCQSIY